MVEADINTARQAVIFASLPALLADQILKQSSVRTYPRGETIFIQGDVAQNFFIVLDGWVKLFRITPARRRWSVCSPRAAASGKRWRSRTRPIR